MNILLVGASKLKLMPYIKLYLENLNYEKNNVYVVYWNRDLNNDIVLDYPVTMYEYKCYLDDYGPRKNKIGGYIGLRKVILNVLESMQIDFIVVMQTMPAIAIIDVLLTQYKGRYIYDYRDATFEKHLSFRAIINSLAKKSKYTFVSSEGFKRFFTKENRKRIIITHNIVGRNATEDNIRKKDKVNGIIKISYWGIIREKSINIALINQVGHDERFEVHFYGKGFSCINELKEFVTNRGFSNVFFHGEYQQSDIIRIVKETDLIHNIYEGENTCYAMGNKYYDGIKYRIPQLVYDNNSQMSSLVLRNGIGLVCNPYEEAFCDKVYKYFQELNEESFYEKCEKEYDRIINECNSSQKIVRDLC